MVLRINIRCLAEEFFNHYIRKGLFVTQYMYNMYYATASRVQEMLGKVIVQQK